MKSLLPQARDLEHDPRPVDGIHLIQNFWAKRGKPSGCVLESPVDDWWGWDIYTYNICIYYYYYYYY